MTYTGVPYLGFLAAAVLAVRCSPPRFRAFVILAASYLFYFTWSVPAAALLAAMTIAVFAAGRAIERAGVSPRGKWLASLFIAGLVLYLLAFKVALLGPTHGIAGLVMPLGISYVTFKLISYLLDVH